jgi:2',3'-cyclic-nucleotide 2'-phosphodiesterase (5'-nucleotidase family)
MNRFYDIMKLDGAAIGNHEFDFGYSFAADFLNDRNSSNLAANIKSGNQTEFLPKQRISRMFTFKNGIKIGIIGLITKNTAT